LIDVTDEYPGRQDSSLLMRVGLLRSINTVLKMKRNVVLVSDIPILKYSPKHFNYISQRFNSEALDFRRILPTLDEYRDRNKNIIDIFDQVSKLPNVTIINPETMFFDGNEDIKVIFNNNALYIDATHLSTQGSQFISPIFDTVLKKMAEIK
jgi:AAA+ ATPase superfamily predicted ATPase